MMGVVVTVKNNSLFPLVVKLGSRVYGKVSFYDVFEDEEEAIGRLAEMDKHFEVG
jgi:hypothetical protein